VNRPLPIWYRTLAALGSLKLTVLGLALLTTLTVWGTLYQARFGLYRAQERFYQSWFFLGGGWLPFPGAQTVLLILFLNLAASMILLLLLGKQRFGLFVTHAGLILMLAAGATTFYFGSESQLTLEEGEGSNVAAAYHDWEVAAWPAGDRTDDRRISAFDVRALRPGTQLRLEALGLDLAVESVYANCTPTSAETADGSLLSASDWTALARANPEREPVLDRPGVILRVASGGERPTRVLLWGGDSRPVRWGSGDDACHLALRRKRVALPAVIRLIDFTKEFYPGSQIAKSFSSRVTVEDGELERQVLISMNKPLRYRRSTFYQSSYQELPGGRETSTLAVVKNYGRLMPYIATAATVIGMCLHFIGLLVTRLARAPKPAKGRA
jgi:hypothetical protein